MVTVWLHNVRVWTRAVGVAFCGEEGEAASCRGTTHGRRVCVP